MLSTNKSHHLLIWWDFPTFVLAMDTTHNTSQQRSLVLDIGKDHLGYLSWGGSNAVESGSIAFDSSLDDYRQALENAVYDNTFLLEDYDRTLIAVHSQHFTLLPQQLVDNGLAEKVMRASFTTLEGDFLTHPIAGTDAAIACDVPLGVVGFLRRTFTGASVMHHLVPLCSYCVKSYAEETACMHISLFDNEARIVVVKQGKLQMANTFTYRALEDVAYYALNMWKTCSLESRRDKVMLTGDNEPREQLAEQLRQWIAYVMPEVIPAQVMQFGRDAMTIPFNLITTALL